MSASDQIAEWLRNRPKVVQGTARRFPPSCVVKSRHGFAFLVPAPGVVGTVESYFESGGVGVVAPMAATITSPITGNTAHEGEMIRGEVGNPHTALEVVGYAEVDGVRIDEAFVEGALDGA